jgi:hypothetical protein
LSAMAIHLFQEAAATFAAADGEAKQGVDL